MSTEKIDSLLQQYLLLLNEYTTLRGSLNNLQSALYQHLARANFSAQPGVRYYGQDYYDERMQATSRLETSVSPETNTPQFKLSKPHTVVVKPEPPNEPADKANDLEEIQQQSENEKSKAQSEPSPENSSEDTVDTKEEDNHSQQPNEEEASEGKDDDDEKSKPKERKKSNEPLRWFGILTPFPLRQAQAQAKKAVEDVIPRLASLSEQMKALELEVRRERKKRAKAEKEEARLKIKELEDKVAAVEV
ncbi:hypothetical protein QBC36DRAFT_49567 [Triangularia setosa]|uniref:Vacuolar ATPase assembly protein VMA22 n=1 Tax=Triangularia setosa TaxID=2587417 RepID=A0AAN6WGF6_9PEZI|nr:hypothetical protein QBC36DRAFT_49567 [Podospora setosa]